MKIRHATLADVPQLVSMSNEFYPLTSYSKYAPFDYDTIHDLTVHIVEHGIYLVGECNGEIQGMLALVIVPFMFNRNITTVNEVVWWVNPAAQRVGMGQALVRRADEIRLLRGIKAFQMVRLTTSPKILDDVYLALGFQPSEFCFTKVD
jgi:hypothetical protein